MQIRVYLHNDSSQMCINMSNCNRLNNIVQTLCILCVWVVSALEKCKQCQWYSCFSFSNAISHTCKYICFFGSYTQYKTIHLTYFFCEFLFHLLLHTSVNRRGASCVLWFWFWFYCIISFFRFFNISLQLMYVNIFCFWTL